MKKRPQCKAEVHDGGRGVGFHRCPFRAREGEEYCYIHCPVAEGTPTFPVFRIAGFSAPEIEERRAIRETKHTYLLVSRGGTPERVNKNSTSFWSNESRWYRDRDDVIREIRRRAKAKIIKAKGEIEDAEKELIDFPEPGPKKQDAKEKVKKEKS